MVFKHSRYLILLVYLHSFSKVSDKAIIIYLILKAGKKIGDMMAVMFGFMDNGSKVIIGASVFHSDVI